MEIVSTENLLRLHKVFFKNLIPVLLTVFNESMRQLKKMLVTEPKVNKLVLPKKQKDIQFPVLKN